MARFTKEMSILEALEADPGARTIFEQHGMTCCLCIGAQSESIEAGAIMHQVDPDLVVDELNRLADPGDLTRGRTRVSVADLTLPFRHPCLRATSPSPTRSSPSSPARRRAPRTASSACRSRRYASSRASSAGT